MLSDLKERTDDSLLEQRSPDWRLLRTKSKLAAWLKMNTTLCFYQSLFLTQ